MKLLYIIILALPLAVLFSSCGPSDDEVSDFNKKIVTTQLAFNAVVDQFIINFFDDNQEDRQLHVDNIVIAAATCLDKLSEIKFEPGEELRLGVVDLATFYANAAKKELPELITLMEIPEVELTDQNEIELSNLLDFLDQNGERLNNHIHYCQDRFARKFGFVIR